MQVYRNQVELPSGVVIDDFYRIRLPDFSIIAATTPDNRVLVVRGYQYGIGKTHLSLPAGMIDPGESPLETAQRELTEETGYTSTNWTSLGEYMVDSNRDCGTMYLFHAANIQQSHKAKLDETESWQCCLYTRDELSHAMFNGEIASLSGLAAAGVVLVRMSSCSD